MISGLFKMLPTNHLFTNHIYLIFMHKEDLALNNLQWLICHKTQPTNQPFPLHLKKNFFLFYNLKSEVTKSKSKINENTFLK